MVKKYCWLIMPFGLQNDLAVFVSMTYNLQEMWTRTYKVNIGCSNNHGSTIIIDNTLLFADTFDKAISILLSLLEVTKRYNLTWKLKKCRLFDSKVEFVEVVISSLGN